MWGFWFSTGGAWRRGVSEDLWRLGACENPNMCNFILIHSKAPKSRQRWYLQESSNIDGTAIRYSMWSDNAAKPSTARSTSVTYLHVLNPQSNNLKEPVTHPVLFLRLWFRINASLSFRNDAPVWTYRGGNMRLHLLYFWTSEAVM
jgi:hypothetical protein